MKKSCSNYFLYLVIACSVVITSCKKDNKPTEPVITNYATIGLYQKSLVENGITYKRVFTGVTIGSSTQSYPAIFDTGSTGLTVDARNLIPADKIKDYGIEVGGDSTIYNGITVTSFKGVISFGGGASGTTHQYGHLAYASVTIGDGNGSVNVKRIPFFLYYKVTDGNGNNISFNPHEINVFGVGPGYSYANSAIGSPLSYFTLPTGVTNGFKLALFTTPFTPTPTYVPGLVTIGLTPTDLNSSGFKMHNLDNYPTAGGYSPNIRATLTFNNKTINAFLLFDTGDPAITYLADPVATGVTTLPAGTVVSLTTNNGFSYQYTTATSSNVTQVVNSSSDPRSIFSIDFFVKNEYLMDYQNHRIGLKNN
ncbi:hypothetical protein GCM10027049_00380 [Mucilaginibacter puniceus]